MVLNLRRGFTLIELLVVIAIIGILASVVLASLNTARGKGSDAAIRSTINNLRAQAELYYDNQSNSYDPGTAGATQGWVCSDQTFLNGIEAVNNAGGVARCYASAQAWSFSSTLPGTTAADYYCVDSTGRADIITTAPAATATVCPAS